VTTPVSDVISGIAQHYRRSLPDSTRVQCAYRGAYRRLSIIWSA